MARPQPRQDSRPSPRGTSGHPRRPLGGGRDPDTAQAADRAGAEAKDKSKKGLTAAARLGYAARGLVYLMVGVLAFMAAFGLAGGGQTTGAKGAIQAFLGLPGGPWLVGAVAVGLFGFALWRLIAAAMDADRHGSGAKGIALRVGMAVSGVLHGVLGLYAASLIWAIPSAGGGGDGGDGQGSGGYTAQLMAEPWGRWVIAGFGVIAIGVAAAQVIKAVKKTYRRNLHGSVLSKGWLDPVARFGLTAKAVTLALVGVFLLGAVFAFAPGNAQRAGLPQALQWVQGQPWGQWLLGLVALGLVCFGLYGLIQARYRIIPDPT